MYWSFIKRCLKDKGGVTAIEYGLIGALVCVVAIAGMSALGTEVGVLFDTVVTKVGAG